MSATHVPSFLVEVSQNSATVHHNSRYEVVTFYWLHLRTHSLFPSLMNFKEAEYREMLSHHPG